MKQNVRKLHNVLEEMGTKKTLKNGQSRGKGIGGAGGALALPMCLETGKTLASSTPNISTSKEGAAL